MVWFSFLLLAFLNVQSLLYTNLAQIVLHVGYDLHTLFLHNSGKGTASTGKAARV